ncbi:MAG: type IV toxin-antitoxin system AbiEi family antitoxin domain-containing protein [Bradyrhizobium sp.]|nr:type IV toxin-antitoxin system AbiEi family antitoxin domain-containing protein [Bradyrhizobium sp.]
METRVKTQPERALSLLEKHGIVRLSEFVDHGITSATISRLEQKGQVGRLSRGLYQLPGAELDAHHSLAEAAKRVPKGIICLTSALAFHELTDTIPSRVWMAIGSKDWQPVVSDLPLQIVRFGPKVLSSGIEAHKIEGVTVNIFNPAKTIVDLFRYRHSAGTRFRQSPGVNLAIEGLRNGLKSRKATPAAIAKFAEEAGIWKVIEPYLDALSAND